MSDGVEQVYLFDVAKGDMVEAELRYSITDENLADWKDKWQPVAEEAARRCEQSGQFGMRPETLHWDWCSKAKRMRGLLAKKAYSVVCLGVTQGLMQVTTTRLATHPSHRGKPMVYIDYLESAPWNSAKIYSPGRYRGVGSILLGAAINLSFDEDFSGRIGLHSLPGAEKFYRDKCKMIDLGCDYAVQGLRYFEMTQEEARNFSS